MYNEQRDILDEKVDQLLENECMCPHCLKDFLQEIFEMGMDCGEDLLLDELEDYGVCVEFDEEGICGVAIDDEEDEELENMIGDYDHIIECCEDTEEVKNVLKTMVDELLEDEI